VPHGVGQQQRAEAPGAVPPPDVAHRGAAAGRRRGPRVLHRRRARRQLQRQVVRPRLPALAVRAPRRRRGAGQQDHQSDREEEGPHRRRRPRLYGAFLTVVACLASSSLSS
jgi:hypothetical protein